MTSPPDDRMVAFFRNLNLGQRRSNSPTSGVLVEAFTTAGATWVANFQTNGTVVFDAANARSVISRVRPLLFDATGYTDAVVVRAASWVLALGQRLDPLLPAGEVALFDANVVPDLALPWVDPSSGLAVLELDPLHAVTSWTGSGTGSGSNPALTRMLGVPVTCRGVPTMIRLGVRLETGSLRRPTTRGPA